MINTIFYFPLAKLTYSDYAAAVQNGEISGRTIVLDKASGKIFNQGKEYGYSKLEIDESVDRKIGDVKNDMDDVVDELNNTLDDLNDHIDDVNNNLDNVINDLDDNIQDKVEDMVKDSEWIQQNWPQGVTQYDSGWNENVKAYLLTVGLWDYGDDGSIVTKWSQLRQSVNNVSSEVNQVTKQGGRLDTLQSAINQEITDRGEAITQLSNTYTNTDAQTKKVLEWMYSGLKSSASANKSFNELYSAANSGDTTAISGLRTDITNQLGNYVASTDLSSRVEGVLKNGAGVTSLANLAQKSDITSATTTLVNTYQLAGLQTSLSGLLSKADANEARLDIVTSLGENNTYTYNKSTLDSAVAGLMAETNTETNLYLAGLKVSSGDGQASTELSSAINNNKNDIARLATKITGDTRADATVEAKLNDMSASLVTTSTLDTALVNVLATNNSGSAASIKTLAGDSSAVTSLGSRVDGVEATIDAVVDGSGSSVMIKADKIQLDGNTVANSISANNMTLTGHVQANDFQAGSNNSLNIKTTGNKISFCDGATEKAYFILEGSGLQLYIMDELGAWRKIKWDSWASTTSYTVLNLYQHTGGDDAANAFTLKNVYVANGNVYNSPDTTSGTPTGTFYIKTTPWEFISLDSSQWDQSTSVLYMGSTADYRAAYSDHVDPVNIHAPIFSGYIDTYVEVLITNGQVVYNRNSNKYNIARQYPTGGIIYESHPGVIGTSSIYNSSTPIFINIDSNLPNDDYDYMYMYDTFYNKLTRIPSNYITGTCVKKVNTFNDARTTSVFSFTEYEQ